MGRLYLITNCLIVFQGQGSNQANKQISFGSSMTQSQEPLSALDRNEPDEFAEELSPLEKEIRLIEQIKYIYS